MFPWSKGGGASQARSTRCEMTSTALGLARVRSARRSQAQNGLLSPARGRHLSKRDGEETSKACRNALTGGPNGQASVLNRPLDFLSCGYSKSFGLTSSSDCKSPRNHRWAKTGLAQSIQSVDRPAGKKTRARRPLAAQIRIQNQAAQPNNAPHRWNQRTRASLRAQQRSREPPRTWLTTLWRPRPSARA